MFLAACHHPQPKVSGPLPQGGYLWQREWTPAVVDAMQEAGKHMDRLVILGAEIRWEGGVANTIRANIQWDALKNSAKPCSIALRIAPFEGPFTEDDVHARAIVAVAKSLLDEARAHHVELAEFQIDFDCGQKKLAGYRTWLHALRPVVSPLRLTITTLPSWLDEAEFPELLGDVDGYVLQVHSVPTAQESGHADLCDTVLARKWVEKASKLGKPFSVALPTYWCVAGYDPAGKLLGVAMDSVQPSWPQGTQVLEFGTDADALAALVNEWLQARPAGLQELLWYRVPVATDMRNWRWPTLSAVMAGRKPARKIEAVSEGGNPTDISIVNTGEADGQLDCSVVVTWSSGALVASDALPGWRLSVENDRAVFTMEPGSGLRLSPGGKRPIGWLRHDQITTIRLQVEEHGENSH